MMLKKKTISSAYGDWESPISSDFVVSKMRILAAPRACPRTGRAYFTETNGARRTIVQVAQDGSLNEVLPEDQSCQNAVYEYGAGLYDVLPDGRLIFSDQDNAVRILEPDAKYSSLLARSPVLRYSSFHANTKNPWVLAIEEDHTDDAPSRVQNHLVAINILTGEFKRAVSGADFYWLPQFNADGSKIAWLEWNHPHMFFDACKLYTADFRLDGTVSGVRHIAGGNGESVTEPRWGLDGATLFFAQETSGYRQLFRLDPGSAAPREIKLSGLEASELGEVYFFEGSRTFVPVTERFLAAVATTNGARRLLIIDLEDDSWREAADGDVLCQLSWDAVARLDDSHVLVVGSGTGVPQAVHKINIHQPEHNKIIRLSVDEQFPKELIATPDLIRLPCEGPPNHSVYGFFWKPTSDKYELDASAPFPLIINAHGGPTGHTGPGLSYRIQYFTSRGYGYFAMNYTGSTGHGRDYRNALWGNWGLVDTADAAAAANWFVQLGSIGKVGITGLSAGGYNTLQCLTRFPDTFAGGVCASGVSELKKFDEKTHKLESHYTPALVLPKDATDEQREEIYKERSALYQVDKIKAPLLLVHGQEDTIVPVEQARLIADSLKESGKEVKIVEFPGDGHMLTHPESVKGWLEEEEKWWRKTLR
ncbi:peptidase s9 [Trichoderma cornu-damae]|uniref:Peptidase s9 n=1 Tax=Trichoderma cornu-damae TaxID=654480 RepID=A0A9P8QPF2_9HYPO|nr:peptidase s9 [Trichoderma cornu-damae]